ncbi:hypothetical protein QFZ80_006466 [Paenibacillus sp. V4I7]|nr:hypothetical protein [Paenibacillus sp. V4I7]
MDMRLPALADNAWMSSFFLYLYHQIDGFTS